MKSENKKGPSQNWKGPRVASRASPGLEESLQQNRLGIPQSTHITNECDEKISKLGAEGCA
jgi:hypothetical protein